VVDRPSGAQQPRLFSPDVDLEDSKPLSALVERGALSETVTTSRQ
jgi:hypothetical protein